MNKQYNTAKHYGRNMHPLSSIVFLGSGPVAAKSLSLLKSTFTVEAIITKPTTRQQMEGACPSTPVYTVNNRLELDQLILSAKFSSECALLVDFGIIVSQTVIDTFSFGIINSHFSLLPQWRGADPITFAILSGQTETGVSLMLLTAGMDEGPLLAQAVHHIELEATAPRLTNDLIELSDAMLTTIVPLYLNNGTAPTPQLASGLLGNIAPTYSRKISKDDGVLDWAKPAAQLEREIRAFIEWPKSRMMLAGKDVLITKARTSERTYTQGQIVTTDNRLFIGCNSGTLELLRLKPAGKAEMDVESFLTGYGRNLPEKAK